MDRSYSDDSEIEEERAGGGAGPTGEGPEQEDRGRIRADVYLECGSVVHMYCYDRTEMVLNLFRSIRFQRSR